MGTVPICKQPGYGLKPSWICQYLKTEFNNVFTIVFLAHFNPCMQDTFAHARTRPKGWTPLGQARARRYGILYTTSIQTRDNKLQMQNIYARTRSANKDIISCISDDKLFIYQEGSLV